MGPIYSFLDFIEMLRRRAFLIFVVTCLGAVMAFFVALQKKHEYESSVVIQVAQPKVADDLASSTVDGSSARRIQLIEQRLMARGTLLEIADQFELYQGLPLRPSEIVDLMRRSISITGVAAAREGFADDGSISVLTITARMGSPEHAQLVADEFAKRTIDLDVQSRIEQARETLQFFSEKENALATGLSELERQMAEYRDAHEVTLPGVLELRRNEISQINETLLELARDQIELRRAAGQVNTNERQATAQRKLAEFNDQIAGLDDQIALLTARKSNLEQSLQTSPQVERQLGTYMRQIQQLQSEYNEIIQRRNEAEVGFRLESSSRSERLTIIEPAILPDFPVTSGRKKLVILGLMGSFVLGVALAFVKELQHPVLRTAEQLERETGLTPVVTIPELITDGPKRRGWFARRPKGDTATL